MKIQSISVVIPTKKCVNNCPFCVSKMHDSKYELTYFNEFQIRQRLKYAKINGVTSLILTGTGEPLQNTRYLSLIKRALVELDHPFPNVEVQTTGVFLNKKEEYIHPDSGHLEVMYPNIELLADLGVTTISLSVTNIFNSDGNMDIIGVPDKLRFDLDELCSFIKSHGLNIRLSINMTNIYDEYHPQDILDRCKGLGANQITFRQLYQSPNLTEQDMWVKNNKMSNNKFNELYSYIVQKGELLYSLPFGATVFSIQGMSVAVDDDCMNKNTNKNLNEKLNSTLKYVILRENGKLYCRWDDEGSLIF